MDDKRFFSRVGFSYFMMVVLTVAVQFLLSLLLSLIAPQAAGLPVTSWLLAMVPLYLVAIPVCAKMMQALPNMQLYRNEMRPGQWIRTLCICIFVMYVGNIIGNAVSALIAQGTGLDLSFELEELLSQGSPWFTLLFSVVLAPVMEELIFRKVLIDRTIVYGDKAAVVLSGLLFGVFHGNFHQFFYAFGLGCIFAYVYPHRKAEIYDFVAYGSEYAGWFSVFLVVATAELQCLGYFRSVCLYRYDVQSCGGCSGTGYTGNQYDHHGHCRIDFLCRVCEKTGMAFR